MKDTYETELRKKWADYLATDSGKYTTIDFFINEAKEREEALVKAVEESLLPEDQASGWTIGYNQGLKDFLALIKK